LQYQRYKINAKFQREQKLTDKLIIAINQRQIYKNAGTLGMGQMLSYLRDSDLFEVKTHEIIHHVHRGFRGTIVTCHDKEIYIDFWEYPAPTFMPKTINRNFDLIVALQCREMLMEEFNAFCKRKGLFPKISDEVKKDFLGKIVPWTFFPSSNLCPYIGKEEELWNKEIERQGFFCGKFWRGRNGYIKSLTQQDIEVVRSEQGEPGGMSMTDEEYLHKMKTSRYGIVLRGRSCGLTDCKNRREIDYMMMKKPLLLNYRPYYYNSLVEGEHYIYFDAKTDLKSIENKYDVEQIAENGYNWYKENASPEGAAKVFRQILNEQLGV